MEWAANAAEFLLELFTDRTDAYSKLYWSPKTRRPEWACTRRPLTIEFLANALVVARRQCLAVGVYHGDPVTQRSRVLAFDLDAHAKPDDPPGKLAEATARVKRDADAIVRVMTQTWQFPRDALWLTTSKSGNGVHLYAFFLHPMPVSLLYHLGVRICTAAQTTAPGDPGMDLYPPRPVVNGLGKALALPLFPAFAPQGGCLFLTPAEGPRSSDQHDYTPVEDQGIEHVARRISQAMKEYDPARVAKRCGLDPDDPLSWTYKDGKRPAPPPPAPPLPAPAPGTPAAPVRGKRPENVYTREDVENFFWQWGPGEARQHGHQLVRNLRECPWAAERHPHAPGTARAFWIPGPDGTGGAPGFKCHHAACKDENFASVKARWNPRFRPSRLPPPSVWDDRGAPPEQTVIPRTPLTRWERDDILRSILEARSRIPLYTEDHPNYAAANWHRRNVQDLLTTFSCMRFRKSPECPVHGHDHSYATAIPCTRRETCTCCSERMAKLATSTSDLWDVENMHHHYTLRLAPGDAGDRAKLKALWDAEKARYYRNCTPRAVFGYDRIEFFPVGTRKGGDPVLREVTREEMVRVVHDALVQPAQVIEDILRADHSPENVLRLCSENHWLNGNFKGQRRVRGGKDGQTYMPLKTLKQERAEAQERERQHDLDEPTVNRDTCQAICYQADGSLGRCRRATSWSLFFEGATVKRGVKHCVSARDAVTLQEANRVLWMYVYPGRWGPPVREWRDLHREWRASGDPRAARAPPGARAPAAC